MANRYWRGGAGRWDDSTHWDASSTSGAGPASVPTSADNVFINAASGGGPSMKDIDGFGISASCADLTTSTYTLVWDAGSSSHLSIYGNLDGGLGTFYSSYNESITFRAASGSKTINMQTTTALLPVTYFQGGATYTLMNNIDATTTDEETSLGIKGTCTVDMNGKQLKSHHIGVTETATVICNGGTMFVFGRMYGNGTSFTVGASATYDAAKTGTLKMDADISQLFSLSGLKTAGTVTVQGGGTDNATLALDDADVTTLNLNNGHTGVSYSLTIRCYNAKFGNITTNKTTPAGRVLDGVSATYTQQILSATKLKPSYLTIKNMHIGAGGPVLADATCVDGGGNVGVLFGKKLPGFGAML